jgi:hypothetical protein
MIVGSWVTQAIYVAAEIGIADLLDVDPRTAKELAKETQTHDGSLYRVLRALASVHIFREDAEGRFSLTEMGKLLRSDAPGSKRSLAIMAGAEFYRSWGGLLSSVETGGAAFDKVFGTPFFRYMSANPDRWRIYDAAMTGVHDSETVPVLAAYDFLPFQTIVDVGGGRTVFGGRTSADQRRPDRPRSQRHRGCALDLDDLREMVQVTESGIG